MAEAAPGKYLLNMSKSERKGRIFLDYLRNDRLSTAVGPLSPRARDGAPVSMPVHWSQVRSGLDPLKYTIRTAPGLLSKNKPWEDYDDGARSLVSAIHKSPTPAKRRSLKGWWKRSPSEEPTGSLAGVRARARGRRPHRIEVGPAIRVGSPGGPKTRKDHDPAPKCTTLTTTTIMITTTALTTPRPRP